MSSQDGADIAGGALNARGACGTGRIAEVEFKAFVLGRDVIVAGDGAMGVEKLVGDVGHDGGAAGGNAAFGDEDEEAGKKRFDVETGAELGELGTLANDGFSFDFLVVDLFVSVVVWAEAGAFERQAGK